VGVGGSGLAFKRLREKHDILEDVISRGLGSTSRMQRRLVAFLEGYADDKMSCYREGVRTGSSRMRCRMGKHYSTYRAILYRCGNGRYAVALT
jgi:hypothetical protein